MFEKVPGKYDLLKMDYSKGKDTPDSAALAQKAKKKVSFSLIMVKLGPLNYSKILRFLASIAL